MAMNCPPASAKTSKPDRTLLPLMITSNRRFPAADQKFSSKYRVTLWLEPAVKPPIRYVIWPCRFFCSTDWGGTDDVSQLLVLIACVVLDVVPPPKSVSATN